MKVAIGLPHLTEKYHARFGDSLIALVARSLQAGIEIVRIATYRDNITFARNKIATKALEAEADYLFFLDDDMVFEPDILIRLLEKEKEIVGGMTFIRSEPHQPSFYTLNSDGETYDPIILWKPKHLVECDAIGMAATLIKRNVLEDMKAVSQYHNKIWGFFDNLNFSGEDLRFCQKAKTMGFDIYCDTSILVGHIFEKVVGYGDYKAMSSQKVIDVIKHQAITAYEK